MSNSDVSINVRMYRQGLGDCFLLSFKRGETVVSNLLIDCGLLQGTENAKAIMEKVAADIQETAGAEGLNAVAVTHEHWDHISGFSQAQTIFNEIKFDEVWLGWTEDEDHPQSKAMRERFHKQITGLRAALTRIDAEAYPALHDTVKLLVEDFFADDILGAAGGEGGEGALGAAEGEGVLGASKSGRSATWDYIMGKGTPKYCSPGTSFDLKGLEDEVRIYVLGPPEDFHIFTKTEPSKKDAPQETYREDAKFALAESFFAAVAGGDEGHANASLPFESDLPTFLPFEEIPKTPPDPAIVETFPSYFNAANDWRAISDDWLMMVEQLALHLDSYTNNSCLAFAIELVKSGKVLLFPGDAQFGNWISWKDLDWKIKDKNGKVTRVDTADLLNRTVLYKVGHHGSHNATLREHGLELMNSPDLVAMIPVDRKKAASKTTKTNPKGWEMPEEHLFKRLKEKCRGRIIIADESDHSELRTRCKDDTFIEQVIFPEESFLPSSEEPLYVEYEVKN